MANGKHKRASWTRPECRVTLHRMEHKVEAVGNVLSVLKAECSKCGTGYQVCVETRPEGFAVASFVKGPGRERPSARFVAVVDKIVDELLLRLAAWDTTTARAVA